LPSDDPVQDSVEVPEPPLTVVVLQVHERLVELTVSERVTAPANPLIGATVIVELLAVPALTAMPIGKAVRVKSCTWKTMFVV
jgi:hypothetical protein